MVVLSKLPHLHYKRGKQTTIMPLQEFRAKLDSAPLNQEQKAYILLLWHCGIRKSEAYERVAEDVAVTSTHVIVNFHRRKKRGLEVPPLKLPREFYGVDDILVPYLLKPKRRRQKSVFTYVRKGGKLKTTKKTVKAKWVFPNIHSTTAWNIVKQTLGAEYYPHYLRLRKLSKIGKNREKGSIMHLRSFSGIKSLGSLEAYMGIDEEAQDEAMEASE